MSNNLIVISSRRGGQDNFCPTLVQLSLGMGFPFPPICDRGPVLNIASASMNYRGRKGSGGGFDLRFLKMQGMWKEA